MQLNEDALMLLTEEVSQRLNIHPWEKYPPVLKTKDLAELMNCSGPTALKLIRIAQSAGLPVIWLGARQPRINRDQFRAWWEEQVGPIDLRPQKKKDA